MRSIPDFSYARYLFFIPSFYGAASFGIWLVLYLMKLIKLDTCSSLALTIYLFAELMFLVATFVSLTEYRRVVESGFIGESTKEDGREVIRETTTTNVTLVTLHALGFIGLVKYVVDFSKNLGGLYGFMFAFFTEAAAIRVEAETSSSIGTQLSYAGWIAISLTVYHIAGRRISRWWWIAVILQFVGNLMFIDRTRPLTLFFTSMLMVLPAARNLNMRKILTWGAGVFLFAMISFWMIAEWSGKTFYKGLDESSVLPGITQDIYLYGVSGYAYFNYMLEHREEISYAPVRLLYPINKIFAKYGLVADPPSPILEFYEVPFLTNVGTFLEPFYRDGGMFFVILGTLLYSFGLNSLSLVFLKSGTPLACYAWATLCFTAFICFFVPKISFSGTWFFVTAGMLSLIAQRIQLKSTAKQASEEMGLS
jgi:oligosaccharide repeat unit polymerase